MSILQNLNSSSDAELLAEFANSGSDAAFAEMVRRHLPLVLAVTRRRLGNSGLAEDAAQQVFIALSRRLRKRAAIPCLPAWLQKAAVYEASGIARGEARLRRRAGQVEGHWQSESSPDSAPGLDEALAALPERDREILMLHHFEKMPFAQVAQRLGITEAAAQRRGHRALEKMAGILRSQGRDHDAAFCAMWLGASLSPRGGEVSSGLVSRISVAKAGTATKLPWLPVAAAITLLGGGWITMAIVRDQTKDAHASETPAASAKPARPPVRKFEPRTKDENLTDDVREFITRAKQDPKDAWEWVKQRPEGAQTFLNRNAVRALADRDLPAADRFLSVIEGIGPRAEVIDEIFGSRAEGGLGSAISWAESVSQPNDLRGVHFIDADYINSEWKNHDYAGALGLAKHPKIREWLIRQACEKAAAIDESQIEKLAADLEGNERHIALGHAASLLLQRGDPRAYELLEEMKADLWNVPDLDEVAKRDPQGLLDWVLSQEQAGNRDKIAFSVWHEWGKTDAAAAAQWVRGLNPQQRSDLGVDRMINATVERLLKQP